MAPAIRLRRPTRATSQPVIGVTTAVARMLKVMTQATSSCVADSAPCICGSSDETIRSVVEYSVEPNTTEAVISQRRATVVGWFGMSSGDGAGRGSTGLGGSCRAGTSASFTSIAVSPA